MEPRADQDDALFKVVVNDEEQYALWPYDKAVPAGWRVTGPSGQRDVCLTWIKSVWTDIRPRSVREALAARSAG